MAKKKKVKGTNGRGDYQEARKLTTELEIAAREKGVPEDKTKRPFENLRELIRTLADLHKIAKAIEIIVDILKDYW